MTLIWIAGIVGGITLSAAAFFFVLHLSTNEMVPLHRARLMWRWTVVVLLGSFDFWIFKRVIVGLYELW